MKLSKVLLIENNKDLRHALGTVMNDMGYSLVSSEDATVLENVQQIAPSIILMNVWASDDEGIDACRRLKSCADTQHLPVIMMSVFPTLGETADECGADAFIEMPFDAARLDELVKTYLAAS